jgi:hypothetical protein
MIARSRKRPRVESVIFRDVWWLVRMEALYMISCSGVPYIDTHKARWQIWQLHRYDPRARGERLLKALPARRFL